MIITGERDLTDATGTGTKGFSWVITFSPGWTWHSWAEFKSSVQGVKQCGLGAMVLLSVGN